jgi:Fic family protein
MTDRPVKQVISLIQDQEATIEGLFDFVGGQRELSTFYVKQLHQLLTRSQESTEALVPSTGQIIRVLLIQGDWKQQPNNPLRSDGMIHRYCSPEQVAFEMDQLIAWHHQHQLQKIPPEVEAVWLHHRFTQIHPFQDGNGRVAWCLASLVFIEARWFPLVLTRDDRAIYVEASEQADRGNLTNLIGLFSKSQK